MTVDGLHLNQMAALDVLLTERNVRLAAERMGVTQSAMSHTLRSLREVLSDPLLVRSGNRMMLTPRAEAIRLPLHRALTDLRAAVASRPRFEPRESTRRFSIACSDAVAATLIPALVHRLARVAPSVELALRNTPLSGVREQLESSELDVLVSPARPREAGMKARRLYASGFKAVARRNHPVIAQPLTLDDYCAVAHATVGAERGPTMVDDQLRKLGRSRRVTLVIPYFMAASAILERTDHIITLPDGLADELVRGRRLLTHPVPLRLPAARIFATWHERFDQDPAHSWLREQLLQAARAVAPE